MVSTRAASYDQTLSVPNCSAMPSTTTTTTLTTTTTNAGLVFTQAMSGAITTSTSTTSSPAQSVNATMMSGINSTPNTPNFNSETAINIQRQMRENRDLEAGAQRPVDTHADNQLHAVIDSAIGLGQVELIRLLDERLRQLVPQLVQQSLTGITNGPNTLMQNQTTTNSLPQNPPLQNLRAQEVPPATRNTQLNEERFQSDARGLSATQNIQHQSVGCPPPQAEDFGAVGYSAQQYHQGYNGGGQNRFPPPRTFPNTAQSPYVPASSSSRNNRKVDIEKWRLKFDGTSKSITAEDFIFRLEQLKNDHACDDEEVLIRFPQLLEGPAEDWYWMQRRLGRVHSFEDLKQAFLSQFRKFESDFDVQRRMMDRRQGPQEPFEDYYNAMLQLHHQQREPWQLWFSQFGCLACNISGRSVERQNNC